MEQDLPVWHLQFKPIDGVKDLPRAERGPRVRQYFAEYMKQIADRLEGIQIIKRNELIMSLSLKGPDEACEKLSDFVAAQGIGEMCRNVVIGRNTMRRSGSC